MEYGSNTRANHVKRQYEQLQDARGEPIAIIDCYADGDTVVASGTFDELLANHNIVIITDTGPSEQLVEQGSKLLVGYDAIDEYVESAFTAYETESDVSAGLVALSIIDRFYEHFPEVPHEIIETVARDLCGSSEYIDYLIARESSEAMSTMVDTIMQPYIRSFASTQEAINTRAVDAYAAACTDVDDTDAQLQFILDCRRR